MFFYIIHNDLSTNRGSYHYSRESRHTGLLTKSEDQDPGEEGIVTRTRHADLECDNTCTQYNICYQPPIVGTPLGWMFKLERNYWKIA